jgi:hypothetical protein
MSSVYTANAIAELLAERRPGLGEAATMQVMESLLASKTIGADATTPRAFILAAIDRAAAPYQTHAPVDPKVALDQEVREHLRRSLGDNWSDRYLGVEKARIYSATEKIVQDKMAAAAQTGTREQRFLDSFEHVADLELTPTQRMTQGDLRALDQRDAAAKAATTSPADAPPVKRDAITRLDSANRSNQIAKLSLELSNAKAAVVNHKDNRNLVSYAEGRVTVLTAKLANLGVTV